MKKIYLIAMAVLTTAKVFADPQLTSWLTDYSSQYARTYTTTANRTSGTSVTTWNNQSVPAYADIAQVLYSASWVYVRAPDLPSYVTGPWLNPQGVPGNFSPTNQHLINRFPRTPAVQSGTKTISGTGYSGLYVDGIAVFNFTDGKAWNPTNSSVVSGPHNQGTYYWHRNAPIGEDYNFDYGLGHQNPSGVYHTHQQPIALRYQLGDHVDFNSSTKNYSESASTNLAHSPIVGWAYDGYPIYGPYGYSISNNASSGVRRMVSGYVQRDGQNGTDNLTNNLTTIPAWYARFRQAHFGGGYSTTTTQARASVSGTNTLGTYAEDYSYYGDLTNSATGQKYVMGTNTFDLDEYNGRYCVTPEFPGGTYAYFLDIDASGNSAYPFAIAYEYYGAASGGSVSSIGEAVTTNFLGAADAALTINSNSINTNYVVTLTWSSTEGGTYQVESSSNNVNWATQRTGLAASAGVSSSTTYTNPTTSGTAYARITRTALATYDATGGESGVVAQTNVISFLVANTAPVVANPISTQTATYGGSFSFTFATNVFTDADAGQTLSYTASSSALTNTGIAFNSATRTFSATTVDATNGGTIASSYTVRVIATDNGSPALSATNSFTLTINKAAASVSPNAVTRSYGATNPVFTGSLSGFVAADAISGNFSCTATTNSAPGSYAITPTLNDSGTRLGNYTVTTNAASLTVTQAVLTVAANAATRAYGATNPTFTVTYTGFTNGQNFASSGVSGAPALTNSATTNSAVGSYVITNSLGTLTAANYSFALVNASLTVTQTALSVTLNSTNRTYGATNPVFTGSLTGLKNNDSITLAGATVATTNSAPGNYSITPTFTDPGSKLGNYAVTTNGGTLTISKAALFVAADNFLQAYGTAIPVFTGTLLGAVAGDVFTETFACAATTNSSPGLYPVVPGVNDPGGKLGNYNVTIINGGLTIIQATLLVSADASARAYGATNPAFTASYTGFTNGQTLATSGLTGSPLLTTSATTNSAPGSYVITNTIGSLTSSNYTFTFTNGTLTVTSAVLTVTASNFSRAYGVTNPVFTGLLAGLQNNDSITANYSTTATTNSPAGSYAILVMLNDPGSKLGNYRVTTNQGTLTITNTSGASNYTVTQTSTNSLITLGSTGTQDYAFTDNASGLTVVVRLTMSAYSASNASPVFTLLDNYGSVNRYVHLGVDSGYNGGDGNFVNAFEGANFSATLLSAASGIATNSIKFGITGVGFRFSPKIVWNSSVQSNSISSTNNETLYTMDTGTASLAGTNYTATVRSASNSSDYQFSDFVDGTNYGLALKVSFYVGTNYAENATLASSSYAGGKFSFSVTGTAGSSYVVQVTTNLTRPIGLPFTLTSHPSTSPTPAPPRTTNAFSA